MIIVIIIIIIIIIRIFTIRSSEVNCKFVICNLVVTLIGYGWPPNHCLGNLGIQKFLLPYNNNDNNNDNYKKIFINIFQAIYK